MHKLSRSVRLFTFAAFCHAAADAAADYYRIEENSPAVTYTGDWTEYSSATSSGSRVVAGTLGSTATVTFTGTGIYWLEYFNKQVRGGANVYLDGVLVDTVRARDSGVIDVYGEKQTRYGITGLADTTHVLKIEGAGAPFGFPPNITLDVFYVERGGVTRLIQESDPAITYTGTWVEMDDPSVSGGSVLASREPGATATLRFTGDAISWLSYACPCAAGIARVTPGQLGYPELVTAYSTGYHPQATIYNAPYADATQERELKIEVTGESAASSQWVAIDAFRVQTGSSDGPDTTPPEIVITAPRSGDTVGLDVPLISDVFDNELEYTVHYYVDGAEIDVDTTQRVTKLTYDTWWRTAGVDGSYEEITPVSNGPHVLTAVARDRAGNETRSAPVTVIVDISDPTVILIPPSQPVTGLATIRAVVTGDFATAKGVRFYAQAQSDGTVTFLGEDLSAPYAITRDTSYIPSGRSFSLWAEATDLDGNIVRPSGNWLVHIEH